MPLCVQKVSVIDDIPLYKNTQQIAASWYPSWMVGEWIWIFINSSAIFKIFYKEPSSCST